MSDIHLQGALFGVPQVQATSDDYYTPRWVFDALAVTFDLDVCAPPSGIPWIPAARYLTIEDDGLNSPWEGRVWMNPPYSDPTPWMRRFLDHGNGIALVAFTRGRWCMEMWERADGIVLHRKLGEFVGGGVSFVCPLVAMGEDNVKAISRVGPVRLRPTFGEAAPEVRVGEDETAFQQTRASR